MTIYPVSEGKIRALEEKMRQLGIRDSDFKETFVRASGAGGQNVNKVSTSVVLRHIPSGMEVRCQRERSQALNRFLAKRLLVDKIETLTLGRKSAEIQAREKIRRQKRKRSKRAREKMLESKRRRAAKKQWRGKIEW